MTAALDALQEWRQRYPDLLNTQDRLLLINPQPHQVLHQLPAIALCLQPFKPFADGLTAAGLPVGVEAEAAQQYAHHGPFDGVILLATKHQRENHYYLAWASQWLKPHGLLVVSCPNESGAAGLGQRMRRLVGEVSAFSKRKCRVMWRPLVAVDAEERAKALAHGQWQQLAEPPLWTRAGLFSAQGVDAGSRLLADQLAHQTPLVGCGADLGAGYGYLCYRLLQQQHRPAELHLFEADANALAAAQRNLAPWQTQVALYYHWADATVALPPGRFDWVVMNPPFHLDKRLAVTLGEGFITAARQSLKARGRLYLVANRHLPYEAALAKAAFGRYQTLCETPRYKVLMAQRS